MNNKPKHFTLFKVIGFVGAIIAIIGIINLISGFGDFTTHNFLIGMFLFPIGMFVGVMFLSLGFRPELTKMATKSAKYIQEENKQVLKDIVSTSAEITSEAVTTTAKAVKEGLKDTMYCKHCGKLIDKDSIYCKECGNKL